MHFDMFLLPDLHAGWCGHARGGWSNGPRLRLADFLGLSSSCPYALPIAELGTAFPEEGVPYILDEVREVLRRLRPRQRHDLLGVQSDLVGRERCRSRAVSDVRRGSSPTRRVGRTCSRLVFIWFAVMAAILSFGVGKWDPDARRCDGSSCSVLRVHGRHLRDRTRIPAASAARADLRGVHRAGPCCSSTTSGSSCRRAGDEMKDPQRDVPFTVIRSAIASVLLYGVPILAIVLVLPQQITASAASSTRSSPCSPSTAASG